MLRSLQFTSLFGTNHISLQDVTNIIPALLLPEIGLSITPLNCYYSAQWSWFLFCTYCILIYVYILSKKLSLVYLMNWKQSNSQTICNFIAKEKDVRVEAILIMDTKSGQKVKPSHQVYLLKEVRATFCDCNNSLYIVMTLRES